MTYNSVFRFNTPTGLKGKLCCIVARANRGFWPDGSVMFNAGDNVVALEFETGERIMASRSSVVLADSRLGKQTAWKVQRGGTRMRQRR